MNEKPLIVCPLAFERSALARAGVPGRLTCIGPGESGMTRLGQEKPSGPVILAGVAGALEETRSAGTAYVVSEVIGERGERWNPTWFHDDLSAARIATSRNVLATPQLKRDLALRTGAHLVDQESEPFARLASERGWTWGIVRGVSDDFSTSLPHDIHTWITHEGRTRFGRVLVSCLARPSRIRSLIALRRDSERALASVAAILKSSI